MERNFWALCLAPSPSCYTFVYSRKACQHRTIWCVCVGSTLCVSDSVQVFGVKESFSKEEIQRIKEKQNSEMLHFAKVVATQLQALM